MYLLTRLTPPPIKTMNTLMASQLGLYTNSDNGKYNKQNAGENLKSNDDVGCTWYT